jgi:molybdopterin converting factor small subunit
MRVKIIPPYGCDSSALDARGWTELSEGASLMDALKAVRCSPLRAKFLLVSVNGERVPFDTILHAGDIVGFFTLCAGG